MNKFGWKLPRSIRRWVSLWALVLLMVASCAAPALTYSASHRKAMQTFQRSQQRWIEVDLSRQRLIAWQGKTPVYAILVSTGKTASATQTGVFRIQSRHRYSRMQGDDYDVPDVPYTMYYSGNYAIHGAYWHRRFGTRVSHGCVNVAVDHAKWLFNWSTIGTPVVVHD
ncbi:L,D-transpeptidase [Leptolyngbya sp. FACHB-36]|uniref:L,D-transpeptidase n=1 Tax=Leptolyngbya sp. FACHB-36 TaxID=2692808 RepID=UPI001680B3D7|nr:L,D-transpeptidase [Leptolyngbya sp. FACHB-36]MBD2019838.1 L,D-transpeptidase [Leptolyngbya sp. FACHB-36]